jgi:hypothetical protein
LHSTPPRTTQEKIIMSVEHRGNGHDFGTAFGTPGSTEEPRTQPGLAEQSPRGYGGINGFASGPTAFPATRYPSDAYSPPASAAAPGPSAFGPPGSGYGDPRFSPPNGGHPGGPSPTTGGFGPPTGAFNLPTGGFQAPGRNFNPPAGFGGAASRYDAGGLEVPTSGDRPNAFAVLSLVFAFLSPVAGLVLGIIAKNQIARSRERGGGMALAGIIVGAVFTVFMIVAIVFMIIAYHDILTALSSVPAIPGPPAH